VLQTETDVLVDPLLREAIRLLDSLVVKIFVLPFLAQNVR
jgi:hypothetical protein